MRAKTDRKYAIQPNWFALSFKQCCAECSGAIYVGNWLLKCTSVIDVIEAQALMLLLLLLTLSAGPAADNNRITA